MFKKNVITLAISTVFMSLALSGCDASYAKDPTAETPPPSNEYVSPGGEGTSTAFIKYQDKEVYLNGVNVAWFNFANDFGAEGGLDETQTNLVLDQVKAAGGNSVRWWIHTNGSQNPIWNTDYTAIADASAQAAIIADIKRALDIAAEKGMYIMPCLWSFDMMAKTQGDMAAVLDANYNLLTDQATRESYITNFLNPLLDAVAGHPALIGIDLFNEPENMTEGWFMEREGLVAGDVPSLDEIHTTAAVLSAAIHKKASELDKQVLVTVGPKSLGLYNADLDGGTNHYSDEKMVALGGAGAELDFYAPHYYDDLGKEGAWSPFYHKASFWEFDKPVVIAEFFASNAAYKPAEFDYFEDPIGEEQLCLRLKDNEYAGAMSWQWTKGIYQESVINCVRAAAGVEIPEVGEYTGLYYFDESSSVPSGFVASSETGSATLTISNTEAKSGSALAMTISSAEGEKKAVSSLPYDLEVMPEMATINMWVYIPQATADTGFTGGKIYAKDAQWTWMDSGFINVVPGEWTLFTWTPETKLTEIKELGFEVYAADGVAASDVVIYVDNISILAEEGAEPEAPGTPAPEVPTFTYDFENGAVPSELATSSDTNGDNPATLTIEATAGVDDSVAIVMSVDEPAGAETKPYFKQTGDGTANVSATSFMVKLSSEAASGISGAKVFAKTGSGWDWNEATWTDLKADTWVEVSSDIAWTEVQEVGLSFYGNSGEALTGAKIYIDNIQIDE